MSTVNRPEGRELVRHWVKCLITGLMRLIARLVPFCRLLRPLTGEYLSPERSEGKKVVERSERIERSSGARERKQSLEELYSFRAKRANRY
jgi:hypothetical protein